MNDSKYFLLHALESILDLKDLIIDGERSIKTYSGKLASPHVLGDEFELVLKKIESKDIAKFNETPIYGGSGWGHNKLEIFDIDWGKLNEYVDTLRQDESKKVINGLSKNNKEVNKKIKRRAKIGFNAGIIKGEIEEEREL